MSTTELIAALGSIGEFVGSIAVLATLIYLAVQVRHSRDLLEENRKIALSEVYKTRVSFLIDIHKQLMKPPVAVALSHVDADSPAARIQQYHALDKVEQGLVRAHAISVIQIMDNTLFQYELGLIDQTDLATARSIARDEFEFWQGVVEVIPTRVRQFGEQACG